MDIKIGMRDNLYQCNTSSAEDENYTFELDYDNHRTSQQSDVVRNIDASSLPLCRRSQQQPQWRCTHADHDNPHVFQKPIGYMTHKATRAVLTNRLLERGMTERKWRQLVKQIRFAQNFPSIGIVLTLWRMNRVVFEPMGCIAVLQTVTKGKKNGGTHILIYAKPSLRGNRDELSQ